MTAAQRRKKKRMASSTRLCSELAFLGALLFHAALFTGFKVAPRTELKTVVQDVPECALLRPYDQAHEWEKELYAWATISNPALLSLPDQHHGFAKVRRAERLRPVMDVPGYSAAEIRAVEPSATPVQLSAALATVTAEIHANWHPARPPVPEPHQALHLAARVIWRRPDGCELERSPDIAPEVISAAVSSSSAALSGPTRIEIDREGAFPRVHVQERCGVTALDNVVVSLLRRELFRLERFAEQEESLYSCVPANGKTSTFEVEWRLFLRGTADADRELAP